MPYLFFILKEGEGESDEWFGRIQEFSMFRRNSRRLNSFFVVRKSIPNETDVVDDLFI